MKILLTGFDPFGGEPVNPAYEAVRRTAAPDGVQLIKLKVPTVFGTSASVLEKAAAENRPDAIVMVGQAGGRRGVTVERLAVNLMDASICDNAGRMPVDEPILPGGENALFSTLPVKKIIAAISASGVEARLSNTAGTFVCNQLLYSALALCKNRFPGTAAGFIHLPFLPAQTVSRPNLPSMPLEQMVTALEAALNCIAKSCI